MKKILIILFSLGLFLGLTTPTFAATLDVQQFPSGYFLDPDENVSSSPYYRWYNEDWGWTHNAIAEGIDTVTLSISAWDVDTTEYDEISAYDADTDSWIVLGNLDTLGSESWTYTTFDLTGMTDLYDDIAEGLQVFMDIDTGHASRYWAVALAKSVLNVNQGTLPDPEPNNPVPEPATMLLFGLGLLGLAGVNRRKK